MKLLLDTHVFIWLNIDLNKISQKALLSCEDPNNQLYLSVVSAWEIQIKQKIGKLQMQVTLEEMIQTQQRDNNLTILPVQLSHIYALQSIPFHHNDPFDRLLLAQAIFEEMTFVSADNQLSQYSVEIVW